MFLTLPIFLQHIYISGNYTPSKKKTFFAPESLDAWNTIFPVSLLGGQFGPFRCERFANVFGSFFSGRQAKSGIKTFRWSSRAEGFLCTELDKITPENRGLDPGTQEIFIGKLPFCRFYVKFPGSNLTSWWFFPTHLKNMRVKLDHFPKVWGENTK